jgi:hypothetical protein
VTMKRRDSCGTRTPAEPEVESIPFSGFAGVSITLEEARAAATRHTA